MKDEARTDTYEMRNPYSSKAAIMMASMFHVYPQPLPRGPRQPIKRDPQAKNNRKKTKSQKKARRKNR